MKTKACYEKSNSCYKGIKINGLENFTKMFYCQSFHQFSFDGKNFFWILAALSSILKKERFEWIQ